jgi:ATP-binding cassette subfamily C protein
MTAVTESLDNSTPRHLDDARGAWILQSGELDLFAVPLDSQHRPGRRTFIGTLTPGSVVLGVPDVEVDGTTWCLYGVGVDCVLEPATDWVANSAGLGTWLTVLSSGLEGVVGTTWLSAAGDDAVELEAGAVITSRQGLQWAVTEPGSLTMLGCPAPGTVPVVGSGVLTAARTTTIRMGHGPDPEAGARWFSSTALLGQTSRARRLMTDEVARDADRVQQEAQARADAMSALSAIDAHHVITAPSDRDKVLAACRLLGQMEGIDIVAPPDWARDQTLDPIHAIARASGARVRAVTISDHAWMSGIDTILAFRHIGGDPVIAVARPSKGYDLLDPDTGRSQRLTSQVAKGLRPTGYVFYQPLPTESIGVLGLLRYGLRGARRDLVRTLGLSLVAGLFSLVVPIATGQILGSLVPAGQIAEIVLASVLVFGAVFASTGFLLGRSAALLRLQGRMLARMQSGVWDRLLSLPVQFFARFSVADLSLRITGVENIQYIVSSVASQTLLALVTLVFSLLLLFVYSVEVASIVMGLTLLVVVISGFLTFRQIKRLRAMYDAKGEASAVLIQIVQGIDKVRAAAAEGRALGAWSRTFSRQAESLLASEQLSAIRTAMYAALPVALTLILFAVVGSDPGIMSTAAFLSFVAALGQITAATAQLDLSLGYVLNIVPLFDRLRPILAERSEDQAGASDPGRLTGAVALHNVTYRYPGMSTPVLQDVDLQVNPGDFLAIVGPSGSGKSTIVRLLLGFDQPETGSVTYDGKDLMTLDRRAVRSQIGVALQNASVFTSDIYGTIAGDWPLSEQDAWAAAEKVGLADEIRALPMGMRTLLGNNASTFSGGQRQRLVLAAAIARDPRLVVLDEATSALDSVTQAQVMRSFDELQVTRVVVAHRLSTIRNANRVVVVDRGRIVQQGTYEELATVPGPFQSMVRRQTL